MLFKLVEVKVFEPEVKEGLEPHPAWYRYVNCWLDTTSGIPCCSVAVGNGDWYVFSNNKTDIFLGRFTAEIVGEIDSSRAMEGDRFEVA